MDSVLMQKLKILADSAKYDVSCSSSGAGRMNNGRIGSAHMSGICHTWAADGRCVSLLKVLFTNKCEYNCEYCVSRRDSDHPRASFEPEELARLTIEFYRRNYIEGLFLSSAVEVSPDYTAERILRCLSLLRNEYGFAGYIHAKLIPGVSAELVHRIGLVADRLSVNIEMPSRDSLQRFAPQKRMPQILAPMRQITNTLIETRSLKGPGNMFRGEDLNTAEHYLDKDALAGASAAGSSSTSARAAAEAPADRSAPRIAPARKTASAAGSRSVQRASAAGSSGTPARTAAEAPADRSASGGDLLLPASPAGGVPASPTGGRYPASTGGAFPSLAGDSSLASASGTSASPAGGTFPAPGKGRFAAAGQTTQMIIGAGEETDRSILTASEQLYRTFKMKRVYYSAYIPMVDSPVLPGPSSAPPLRREHRIYQADWLLRFYGFTAGELFGKGTPNLDPDLDPKVTWALRNLDQFPIEVNTASYGMLMRIPGIGDTSARRIIRQRRFAAVRFEDLKKMGVVIKRAKYFLICCGRYYGDRRFDPQTIRNGILQMENGLQLSMFDSDWKPLPEGARQEKLSEAGLI